MKEGLEEKPALEPRLGQPMWQAYSRRKKGAYGRQEEGPVREGANGFGWDK